MTKLDFDPRAAQLNGQAILLAKAPEPDFDRARSLLTEAQEIVAAGSNRLISAIYAGRMATDMGVVDVREGLYCRSHEGASDAEALEYVMNGKDTIEASYHSLLDVLQYDGEEVRGLGWDNAVQAHVCGTMNTWFRATQTAQLLSGAIGPDKPADNQSVADQWMLGRGKPDEPGAWVHGRQGDNGYFAAQTSFLGLRGERINGGAVHALKGLKWAVARGIPELGRRTVTDPVNRNNMWLSAGRLTLQSLTRKHAIEAALDYQRL